MLMSQWNLNLIECVEISLQQIKRRTMTKLSFDLLRAANQYRQRNTGVLFGPNTKQQQKYKDVCSTINQARNIVQLLNNLYASMLMDKLQRKTCYTESSLFVQISKQIFTNLQNNSPDYVIKAFENFGEQLHDYIELMVHIRGCVKLAKNGYAGWFVEKPWYFIFSNFTHGYMGQHNANTLFQEIDLAYRNRNMINMLRIIYVRLRKEKSVMSGKNSGFNRHSFNVYLMKYLCGKNGSIHRLSLDELQVYKNKLIIWLERVLMNVDVSQAQGVQMGVIN